MATPIRQMTEIVRDVLHDPTIDLTRTTRLDDIRGCDSMDIVSIVAEAECRFDVLLEFYDIDRLETVDDLLGVIATRKRLAGV